MHADIKQLIALRDRQPVDVVVKAHIAECNVCSHRLESISNLRQTLRDMPDASVPHGLWQKIQAEHDIETALGANTANHPTRTAMRWPSLAGLAASALLIAFLGIFSLSQMNDNSIGTDLDVNPVTQQFGSTESAIRVAALQDDSQQLERLVNDLGRKSTVMSLGTASAIIELEDSIRLIDYQLSLSGAALDEVSREKLWRQRIELLETLATVRLAQDRANSI